MRLDNHNVVVVESVADIQRAIQEFLPGKKENPVVRATMRVGGKDVTLTAPTDLTYRDMLIEGLTIIKKRMEAIAKAPADIPLNPFNIDGHMWVDDLIKRRLGGIRDGVRVKWALKDGTYFFDPFTGTLTKCSDTF